jgi:hypothetical protein
MCEGVNGDTVQRRALVCTVKNLMVPLKRGNSWFGLCSMHLDIGFK